VQAMKAYRAAAAEINWMRASELYGSEC
jgi:hypothetical protein